MSEQWPHVDTQEASVESNGAGSSSTNGANLEDEVAASDGSVAEVAVPGAEQVEESPATAEIAAEAEAATSAAADAEPAAAADEPDFLTELVRAMQTTAGLERVRTNDDTDRRRQAHIDTVRAREDAQAERMRELAGEDMKAIEAWVASETTRIQLERERREKDLNQDLETSLAEHHAKIEREIETVETAIATYRAEVAVFFGALDSETDPVLIAQQAARRPVFPSLDAADDATTPATTTAESEPVVVGVMDPRAARESIDAWVPPIEPSTEPAEQAEPVAAATGAGESNGGSMIQAMPVNRPMSWLRRDSNSGGHPNLDD